MGGGALNARTSSVRPPPPADGAQGDDDDAAHVAPPAAPLLHVKGHALCGVTSAPFPRKNQHATEQVRHSQRDIDRGVRGALAPPTRPAAFAGTTVQMRELEASRRTQPRHDVT